MTEHPENPISKQLGGKVEIFADLNYINSATEKFSGQALKQVCTSWTKT